MALHQLKSNCSFVISKNFNPPKCKLKKIISRMTKKSSVEQPKQGSFLYSEPFSFNTAYTARMPRGPEPAQNAAHSSL
jgi:hypothetical protein